METLELRCVSPKRFCDLNSQLASRRERQHLRLLELEIEPGQQWQRERGRFPCAGRRVPEQVVAFEQAGYGLGLDRRGVSAAQISVRRFSSSASSSA